MRVPQNVSFESGLVTKSRIVVEASIGRFTRSSMSRSEHRSVCPGAEAASPHHVISRCDVSRDGRMRTKKNGTPANRRIFNAHREHFRHAVFAGQLRVLSLIYLPDCFLTSIRL